MVKIAAALAAVCVLSACGTEVATGQQDASSARTASSGRTATPAGSPSPGSEIGDGQQVMPVEDLAPSTWPPSIGLCSAMYDHITADGGYLPLFCVNGYLNENAWAYYYSLGATILAVGPSPALDFIDSALQDDLNKKISRTQEYRAYFLAAAYYAWTLKPDPACAYLFHQASCSRELAQYSTAQSPVPAEVLPPATVLPVARLCSVDVTATADGNWDPLLCSDGALNVVAWLQYKWISRHILAAGESATVAKINAALLADFGPGMTSVEVLDGYLLAKAYYGWHFSPDPACEYLYKQAACY